MSPQPQPALTPTEFSSAVTAITSAFGDPTRREIYLFVHARSEADPEGQPGRGVTAADVAEQFLLHPNVARPHPANPASGRDVQAAPAHPAPAAARPANT